MGEAKGFVQRPSSQSTLSARRSSLNVTLGLTKPLEEGLAKAPRYLYDASAGWSVTVSALARRYETSRQTILRANTVAWA
jgi:hypothetical protein